MPDEVKFKPRKMNIEVLDISTVGAGQMFAGRTAVLNFANPFGPGAAQEGSLIRASNLYEALISDINTRDFYDVNYDYEFVNPGIYTDSVMYARNVWFYYRGGECVTPWHMDVITCPAPSVKIVPENVEMAIIRHRAECIIKSAILNKVDNLVLGAWGCGVFGQNPEVVSKAFMSVLENYPAFSNVIFAIPDKTSRNHIVFKKNCEVKR